MLAHTCDVQVLHFSKLISSLSLPSISPVACLFGSHVYIISAAAMAAPLISIPYVWVLSATARLVHGRLPDAWGCGDASKGEGVVCLRVWPLCRLVFCGAVLMPRTLAATAGVVAEEVHIRPDCGEGLLQEAGGRLDVLWSWLPWGFRLCWSWLSSATTA